MIITVFGASGQVGSKVVTRLLADGHDVKAFIHGQSKYEDNSHLTIFQGDIHNPQEVYDAITDSDAVISTLGSWHTKSKDILTNGMKNIIFVMEHEGISRIISLTGAGAFLPHEKRNILDKLTRFALRMIAKKVLDDGEHHMLLLTESKLDWTIIRSPIMKESRNPKLFKLSNKSPALWASIERSSVVEALISQLTDTSFIKQAPFISSQRL